MSTLPHLFDYQNLEALDLVITLGTFESAAKSLKISQSAVSQRLKSLEKQVEQRLLIRKSPPQLTSPGEKILAHYRRVKALEKDCAQNLLGAKKGSFTLRLAVNRDSLSTWLPKRLSSLFDKHSVSFDLYPVDEKKSHELLLDGKVDACISSKNMELKDYEKYPLGSMEYLCLISQKLFEDKGKNRSKVLKETPFVRFDRDDVLFESFFSEKEKPKVFHFVPNSSCFNEFVYLGYGFSLLPKYHEKKGLINLFPGKSIEIPLYWYHWEGLSFESKSLFKRKIILEG